MGDSHQLRSHRWASNAPVLPGQVIGVLGGGQLGRMLGIAAKRMGYRLHVLDPKRDCPAAQVADYHAVSAYDDATAVARFAQTADVLTFEFENVPAQTLGAISEVRPIHPSPDALHKTRNRIREKRFLTEDAGAPVSPFYPCKSAEDLAAGLEALDGPCVVKTAEFGYDGKGQITLDHPAQAEVAWSELRTHEAVLERVVDFDIELSVVLARGRGGQLAAFSPGWNEHRNHILDITTVPAPISAQTAKQAVELAQSIAESLQLVGVLGVEMFLVRGEKTACGKTGTHPVSDPDPVSDPGSDSTAEGGDQLIVNELAPRPHNSGHFTFDACVTSQFEQQLRAICGLGLGDPSMLRPAASMANLLGDLWPGSADAGDDDDADDDVPQPPNWPALAAHGDVKLHLYGKHPPRPGRKMGHLTTMADTADQARRRVIEARTRCMVNPAVL